MCTREGGGGGKRHFLAPKHPEQLCGLHRLMFNGYWVSFPGTKQPGREIIHSSLPGVEVKNEWSYTYVPPSPYAFMAWAGKNFSF